VVHQDDWKKDYWELFEETPLMAAVFTYICYGLIVLIGHIRDFLNNVGLLKVNACLEPRIPVSLPVRHNLSPVHDICYSCSKDM